MKRRWDELHYAEYVPEELRIRIGNTPVYEATKVLDFSNNTSLLFAIVVAFLAGVFLALGIHDLSEDTDWGMLLSRIALGLLLLWAAWGIFGYWHRWRRLRAECRREFQEHGMCCDARVVFFEERGKGGEEWTSTCYLYYQFRDDFIIQELIDHSNRGKYRSEGDLVPVIYLRRDPRLSRTRVTK